MNAVCDMQGNYIEGLCEYLQKTDFGLVSRSGC